MDNDTTNNDNIQQDEELELDENLTNQDEQQDVQEEEQQEETSEETQETEQEPEQEERQPSRREQKRVADLLRKYPELDRQKPQTREQAPKQEQTNWREVLDADDEVYEKISQAEKEAYERGMQSAGQSRGNDMDTFRWETNIRMDYPEVVGKHKFLNDRNEETFKPHIANDLNEMYYLISGYDPNSNSVQNPTVRYGDFVDAVVNLAGEIAKETSGNSQRNITQQARRTGLRPDGSAAKSLDLTKDPSEMTDDELNAFLGQTFKNIK